MTSPTGKWLDGHLIEEWTTHHSGQSCDRYCGPSLCAWAYQVDCELVGTTGDWHWVVWPVFSSDRVIEGDCPSKEKALVAADVVLNQKSRLTKPPDV